MSKIKRFFAINGVKKLSAVTTSTDKTMKSERHSGA